MKILKLALMLLAGLTVTCGNVWAAETNTSATTKSTAGTVPASSTEAGDKAWEELTGSLRQPQPPMEWRTGEKQPTMAEIIEFRTKTQEFAEKGADSAKDFYTRFPNHPKAANARKIEFDLLSMAVQLGAKGQVTRLEAVAVELLKSPDLDEDERFEIRNGQIQLAAMARDLPEAEATAAFEKDVRALQKDFPKRPEVWQMLVEVAASYEGDKGRVILEEVVASGAPDEVKQEAKASLKKLDALGKPLDLKFTALDGREVDLSKLKGKVVLVDFWATWCGPCVKELPNVKAAYDKLHPKGFEIVGISFDKDKEKLQSFVKDESMTWPQFFDGEGWNNKFGREFGIHSIPTMWLVDKQGNLRDLEARSDLTAKVEKYLAE